jgi:hypothetical protein
MDADTFGGEDEFAAFLPRASPKKKQKNQKQEEEDNKLMP